MKKIFFVLVFILITLGFWNIGQAKTITSATEKGGPQVSINFGGDVGQIDLPQSKYGSLIDLLAGVADWILGIAGAMAVLAIIYSGIMYITAGGDSAKAEVAKKNLIWAIIGVVIVVLSYLIITWIPEIVGG